MWEAYYKLCSSDEFCSLWSTFLQVNVGLEADPVFFEYVMKSIVEENIKSMFQVKERSGNEEADANSPRALDYEEHNALRYTAGFVIHAQKVKKSTHKERDELLLCLKELVHPVGKIFNSFDIFVFFRS
uniref:Uncharacterized protein n=1 Tax=Amphimedon queenslandica TaxID=400682 RepID=A0A1X7TNF9_AMPQE